jgi:hypothetical protein
VRNACKDWQQTVLFVANKESRYAKKRTLTVVILALAGLMSFVPVTAQQRPQSQAVPHGQRQAQPRAQRQVVPAHPLYQRQDTWYEFLLKQFNPSNFNYGAWIEERRQVFLDASVRNPYFKYSLGTTIALLVMAMLYTKQWIDHRRAMWITAEMMTDLYNHDLYSRDVAEKAIQKYNQHIERCNRAFEAEAGGRALPAADPDTEELKTKLKRATEERDPYMQERDKAKAELATNARTLAQMSLRLDGVSSKSGAAVDTGQSVELRNSDPAVIQHINNLQEQLYAERQKNQRLRGE